MAFYITHLFYLLKLARDLSYPHCCYEQEVSNRNGWRGEIKHPSSQQHLKIWKLPGCALCLIIWAKAKLSTFLLLYLPVFSPFFPSLIAASASRAEVWPEADSSMLQKAFCMLILPNQAVLTVTGARWNPISWQFSQHLSCSYQRLRIKLRMVVMIMRNCTSVRSIRVAERFLFFFY